MAGRSRAGESKSNNIDPAGGVKSVFMNEVVGLKILESSWEMVLVKGQLARYGWRSGLEQCKDLGIDLSP
jgi:hypothetical protein